LSKYEIDKRRFPRTPLTLYADDKTFFARESGNTSPPLSLLEGNA
jgi:hypothetical protein